MPTDCTSLAEMNPSFRSGYYLIRPTKGFVVQVYCDMSTDGGGWIVSFIFFAFQGLGSS